MKYERKFIQILAVAVMIFVLATGGYLLFAHNASLPIPEEPGQTLGSSTTTPAPAPDETPTPKPTGEKTKIIPTHQGSLTLKYKDGVATLSGTLMRGTPCVDWKIEISGTKDLPPSQVVFNVFDASTAAMCIQTLGRPQDVSASSPADQTTHYTVKLEKDLVVFSGKLED